MKTSHKFAAAAGSMFAGSFVLAQSGALEPLIVTMGAIGVACGIGAMIVGDGEYEMPTTSNPPNEPVSQHDKEKAWRLSVIEAYGPFSPELIRQAQEDGRPNRLKNRKWDIEADDVFSAGLPEGMVITLSFTYTQIRDKNDWCNDRRFRVSVKGREIANGRYQNGKWTLLRVYYDQDKSTIEVIMQRFRALRWKVQQIRKDEFERRCEENARLQKHNVDDLSGFLSEAAQNIVDHMQVEQ